MIFSFVCIAAIFPLNLTRFVSRIHVFYCLGFCLLRRLIKIVSIYWIEVYLTDKNLNQRINSKLLSTTVRVTKLEADLVLCLPKVWRRLIRRHQSIFIDCSGTLFPRCDKIVNAVISSMSIHYPLPKSGWAGFCCFHLHHPSQQNQNSAAHMDWTWATNSKLRHWHEFVLLKFGLCWRLCWNVVRWKHYLFIKKYCWSSATE
jgi:hypothetical protein